MNILRVGIVGCGFIGQKRAKSLGQSCEIVACSDINITRAEDLASQTKATVFRDWRDLVKSSMVDIVIVATSHDSLAEITIASVNAGKHVLVEKPGARNSDELATVIKEQMKSSTKVHVGFNHRYHRSLRQAKEIVGSGRLGDLMFIRARYGHGGRIGYEKEWRAKPLLSGGGELIDQGPHLIDLCSWFLGDFTEVNGFVKTYFWDMPVEDNAFMLLKTATQQTAFLHVSCTEWKNMFSMEIFGKLGKLDLSGLGGSYGLEKIKWYKMLPEMGPPETTSWEYPMHDDSWEVEMLEFLEDIRLDRQPSSGLLDALRTLTVVESIYKESDYDYRT